MIPYIHTSYGDISTFTIAIIVGVFAMLLTMHISLKNESDREAEEIFIIPKIIISGVFGVAFSGSSDFLINYLQHNILKMPSVSLYGGLIGSIISLRLQFALSKGSSKYTKKEWFDILTPSVIVFHFCGRIGCFFAGCCYGINTNSVFGLVFPDNIEQGIIHNGEKCYPTQLFEALGLVVILIVVLLSKNKFQVYLLCYSILRFFLEFIRTNEKIYFMCLLSQTQITSLIICVVTCYFIRKRRKLVSDCRKGYDETFNAL